MSVTVGYLYDTLCYDLMEPSVSGPGLTLGLVTQQQFLDLLGVVLLDFLRQTGMVWTINTQQINFGQSQYPVPDNLTQIFYVFQNSYIVNKITLFSNMIAGSWQYNPGPTRAYHEDGLPIKTMELIPAPNWTGSAAGNNSTNFFPGGRGLTLVGSQIPSPETWSMNSTLTVIPDSATPYLLYGVLAKIFSSDSEARDAQRSHYASTRYEEGVGIWKSIVLNLYGEQDKMK